MVDTGGRLIAGRLAAAAIVAAVAVGAPAGAWGHEAHEVVCAIAQERLAPALREEVLRLARLYAMPDGRHYRWFTTSCVFADIARDRARQGRDGWTRFARFDRWHYLNLPRDERRLERDQANAWCGGDCLLHAIRYHAARLADEALPDQDRAEALILLGHWVADLHQPLHVSYADDFGGHAVGTDGDGPNLHQLWDTVIPRRARGERDWWPWAGDLARSIAPEDAAAWRRGDPVDWAAESYALATDSRLGYCVWRDGACRPDGRKRAQDPAYLDRMGKVVERRLEQAGVRLAEIIRRALARDDPR